MSLRLLRPVGTIGRLVQPCQNVRLYASKRTARNGPSTAIRRRLNEDYQLSRDPEVVVRQAHEKERSVFRYALEEGDITVAFKIYIEQREVPILSGLDVTQLAQLISADAVSRSVYDYEQPESIKEVMSTMIEDVKTGQIRGMTMFWVHVLEALATWRQYEQAEELWSWIRTLPNRVAVDKDAMCIDSRVYGAMINLKSSMGAELSELLKMRDEALIERQLGSSLILSQAIVHAQLIGGEIGDAYKSMDEAIKEHKNRLRPAFFTGIMSLALDAGAAGIANEVFMKACNEKCPPVSNVVTRLLVEMGKAKKDSLDNMTQVLERYREASGRPLQMHNVNAVISNIFASARKGISTSTVLERVHELLKKSRDEGSEPTAPTINILLSGYLELGQRDLARDLVSSVDLNEISFRSILKALARRPPAIEDKSILVKEVQDTWSLFCEFRQKDRSEFVARDFHMLMRAALRHVTPEGVAWMQGVLEKYKDSLDPVAVEKLQMEMEAHKGGTFRHHYDVRRTTSIEEDI